MLKRSRIREIVGCWLHERWRTECALNPVLSNLTGIRWQDLCNRHERLAEGDDGACICLWQDSSFLTVARFFFSVGGRLLKHCLREWPIQLSKEFNHGRHSNDPEMSIILPVGGKDRIPLFECVLYSFFGQTCRNLDIIVVENGVKPLYEAFCPAGVRYIFIPPEDGRGFNKCKAMNEGVRNAKASYILLHDADIVVPCTYVESIKLRMDAGWDSVRPVRFAFQLNSFQSKEFIDRNGRYLPDKVELVQQNNPGLSTAVTKEAFNRIGGCDERFEGVGAEDMEFLYRLKMTKLFPGYYAPGVHLWHVPSRECEGKNSDLLQNLLAIPVAERIKTLRKRYLDGKS